MTRKCSYSALLFLLIIFFSINTTYEQTNSLKDKQSNHKPRNVPEHKLTLINQMQDINHFNTVLDNILIPRVVGTRGHDVVRDFIVDSMKELNWHVEIDKFNDITPNLGELTFENIIATYNPKADRYLILACHYDSKYFPGEKFLGATDSAVPCAMLINLAYVLRKYFENADNSLNISLQFVFFDGEEAFKQWGPTDSIYGARHLANKWDNSGHLEKIDMMILLDLLGASDPMFYSFFKQTENWYAHLIYGEERLANAGYLAQYAYSSVNTKQDQIRYFQSLSLQTVIEDDHIPFLRKGVPILHIIPYPFPTFWHQMEDDREAVDIVTVENLNKIFKLFIIEYLHITI